MVPMQPPPPTELCPALKPPAAASRGWSGEGARGLPQSWEKNGGVITRVGGTELRQMEKPNTSCPEKEGGGLEDGLFATLCL